MRGPARRPDGMSRPSVTSILQGHVIEATWNTALSALNPAPVHTLEDTHPWAATTPKRTGRAKISTKPHDAAPAAQAAPVDVNFLQGLVLGSPRSATEECSAGKDHHEASNSEPQ